MKNYTTIFLMMILGFFLTGKANGGGGNPPVNDNFANATVVSVAGGSGSVTTNNHDAGKEAGEPNHAENAGGASVWFKYTPATTTVVRIKTTETSIDTLLGVYTGANVSDLTPIGYNDNCGGSCGDNSSVDLKVTAGTTYYIAVDTRGDGVTTITGQFKILVTEYAAPLQDNFASYTDLGAANRGSIAGTNYNATLEADEPGAFTNSTVNAKSVWYKWTAIASASMAFELDEDFDSQIGIYTADNAFPTFGQLIKVGKNLDNIQPDHSRHRTTFFAEAGKTYYIKIDTYSFTLIPTGNFQLKFFPNRLRYSSRLSRYTQKSSISLFRHANGVWYNIIEPSIPADYRSWGRSFDKPILADFDGDGLSETTVVRDENGKLVWYIPGSGSASYSAIQWGQAGDFISFGDFDLDGRADPVAIRTVNGNYVWYVRQSSDGALRAFTFGVTLDRFSLGDFDGDGRTDLAVTRQTPQGLIWHILKSNGAKYDKYETGQFGVSLDIPVPADFDGDGKSDIAVFRPSDGNWYIVQSSNGQIRIDNFGVSGDKPQPADYNGDGKADLAVFRPSEGIWYIAKPEGVPAQNYDVIPWGTSTDVPVTYYNVLN